MKIFIHEICIYIKIYKCKRFTAKTIEGFYYLNLHVLELLYLHNILVHNNIVIQMLEVPLNLNSTMFMGITSTLEENVSYV